MTYCMIPHICNPVTGEVVNLPKNLLVEEDYEKPHRFGDDFISRFGYIFSADEYKVVRIYARCGYPSKDRCLKVQVYTLGNILGWRDKGRPNIYISKNSEADGSRNGVFANGALHWIENEKHKIVAFDLAVEKFILIPLPSDYSRMDIGYLNFTLKLLGGYLSVYQLTGEQGRIFVDIWSLKKKKQCN
ncbi:uncharacterized protein LOC113323934 [Papaver somniferum]|uniref:uncharacterized protein LOC113323934 n=1 Tax=Papaver somniferum TaxID=3469 RepID=UPI000E6FB4AB|nr:uncharacterized protein LOC113323934 [Papaver somniferum]